MEKREKEREGIKRSRDNSTLESTRYLPPIPLRLPGVAEKWRGNDIGRTRSLERKKEEEKRKKKKRRREEVKGNRAEANGIGQISRSVTVFPCPVRISVQRKILKLFRFECLLSNSPRSILLRPHLAAFYALQRT